jgi:RNA polymerase sigma factor (sigma-70 family)
VARHGGTLLYSAPAVKRKRFASPFPRHVERARRKKRHKHGGGRRRVPLDEVELTSHDDADELLAIHEALDKLAAADPQAAQLVQLRYFAGLSVEQAAETLGLPRSTAYVHWAYAKASLRVLLDLDPDGLPS